MAEQSGVKAAGNTYGKRHPLLIYRFIARRYQPVGVLLFVVGLLAQVPQFITELRPQNSFITYEQLSLIGLLGLLIGVVLWIASILERRQAYVQCTPDYLLIHTASAKVAVAYQRFNTIKTVRVGDLFPAKEYRGRDRSYIKPLAGETALEVLVSDFPLSMRQMQRRLHKFVFSPRGKGFLFIVPRYGDLSIELNSYIDRARQTQREAETVRYENPLDRVGQGALSR